MADHESLSSHRVRSLAQVASLEPTEGLQVTSARLTDRPFGIHIPNGPGACPSAAGIVEADEIDFARCLQLQRPYPGPVEGHFTTCTPLTGRSPSLPQDIDPDDPWQFRNVLVH